MRKIKGVKRSQVRKPMGAKQEQWKEEAVAENEIFKCVLCEMINSWGWKARLSLWP